MLKIKIKPISKWIGKETEFPRRSQFKQTYSNTKKILEFELEKLGAIESSIQIEMFIKPEDLRNDGELRANTKPARHGVILSFTTVRAVRDGRAIKKITNNLSYPCDAFDAWQDNLRAISLSLEALRKVARYGVFSYEDMVSRLSLPSPEYTDRDEAICIAIDFLAYHSGMLVIDVRKNPKLAYTNCALKLHPDMSSGNHELFLRLQEIKKYLDI